MKNQNKQQEIKTPFTIGEEFKKRLLKEGIDPSDIVEFSTENNKSKRLCFTKITLKDGSKHELVDDFVYYAARKNKKW